MDVVDVTSVDILRLNQFVKCCDIHTIHTTALFCITSLHPKPSHSLNVDAVVDQKHTH